MIPSRTSAATARAALLGAAEPRCVSHDRHVHPRRGPEGEELATDVVRFGAPIGHADSVVLVSSGVHGVEGHAGSGLQQLLLGEGRLDRLPPRTAVVLVHAVNPYGFAWSRRVDHDNIDVNRNFVDYADLPDNPRYDEIDPILNPAELDLDDTGYLADLLAFWHEVGDEVAFRTISGGQYSHPRGVQFGGQGPSWSRAALERIWDEHLAGARHALALDIHTGLGPRGRLTVFQTADGDEAAAALGPAWFADWLYRSDRTGSVDHGLLGVGFDAWAAAAPGRPSVATFVIEFGTLEPTEGVGVFRADNWLHHHGDPRSAVGERIRADMRDFFDLDDDAWRRDVADQGLDALHRALDGIEAGDHRP
jgi:predicted deacylase